VSVAGASVLGSVKILGVTLDKHLTFDRHVTNLCQESNFHNRALRHIRPALDRATANTTVSIVNSRLDYCNSILSGSSKYNLQRLQRVQTNLARAVCKAWRWSSASDLLKQLQWLPICSRINYKLACNTHKALNEQSPAYLYDLLTKQQPNRNTSSSGTSLLMIPATATKVAEGAFSFAAPTIWNSLSDDFH